MSSYEKIRRQYRPEHIKVLLIAESPPPDARTTSSRHFYRSDKIRTGDRLFINTVKALYPEAAQKTEAQLEPEKEKWLHRLRDDGWYMIEALEESQVHEITKQNRQQKIRAALPRLLERVKELSEPTTKIILIKSNVFEVAAPALRNAGYKVLNTELVDYPGQYNQPAYRKKLSRLASTL